MPDFTNFILGMGWIIPMTCAIVFWSFKYAKRDGKWKFAAKMGMAYLYTGAVFTLIIFITAWLTPDKTVVVAINYFNEALIEMMFVVIPMMVMSSYSFGYHLKFMNSVHMEDW